MRVELGPEADAELEEATAWYLAQGLDDGGELAERFIDEVERGVGLIAESAPSSTPRSSPEFVASSFTAFRTP